MHRLKEIHRDIVSTEYRRSIFFTALFLLIGLPLANSFAGFWRLFFCLPSAQICSVFLGADCVTTPAGYMLVNEHLSVHVTKACSAASFFVLLSSLFAGTVVKSIRLREFFKIVRVLPLAYVITIAANSSRIIGGWVTGRWARSVLPESFWAGVHLGTGIAVFLTFLIVSYMVLRRRFENEHQRATIADRG
jgi:exosortase K